MKRVTLLVSACVLAVMLCGCGVELPDVKGMTVDQASEALEAAGFTVGDVVYDEQANGAVGAVVSQKPAAGERVDEGSMVVLTVAGPPPVETPSLSGLDREKAQVALTAVGLSVGNVSESWDATVAAGLLVSQEPSSGVDAPKGSAVNLVFSKGPKPVFIPKVTGKSLSDAKKALEGLGFTVKTKQKDDRAKKGTVLSQDPVAGKKIQPGKSVTLVVSSGKPAQPSSSEAASAIKRALGGVAPTVDIANVRNIRIWQQGGRWWASGWAIPVESDMYDAVEVIVYKKGDSWILSNYGTDI